MDPSLADCKLCDGQACTADFECASGNCDDDAEICMVGRAAMNGPGYKAISLPLVPLGEYSLHIHTLMQDRNVAVVGRNHVFPAVQVMRVSHLPADSHGCC